MVNCARGTQLLPSSFRPIRADHLGYLPPKEVLGIATGSQGEFGAALHRLMTDTHPSLSLDSGDTVILSSKTIPGNESSVKRLTSGFRNRGIEVIEADENSFPIHASGHPCKQELIELYQTVNPRLVIPVHGENAHMKANAEIALQTGVDLALTGQNGDLFYLNPVPGIRRNFARVGRLQWSEEHGSLMEVGKVSRL